MRLAKPAIILPAIALLLALLLNTFLPSQATAQDWCLKTGLNPAEREVCIDPELGALDDELNRLYRQQGGDGASLDSWRRLERDACGRDAACIAGAYRERLAAMRADAGQQDFDASRRPWCRADPLNPTERAICSSDMLANLDAALGAVYGRAKAADSDAEQLDWLRQRRDGCGPDADCIAAAYLRRIAELGGRLRARGE